MSLLLHEMEVRYTGVLASAIGNPSVRGTAPEAEKFSERQTAWAAVVELQLLAQIVPHAAVLFGRTSTRPEMFVAVSLVIPFRRTSHVV
jgi:hypothetical protein